MRRDHVVPLSDHFRKQFAKRHKKTVRGVSGAASRRLFSFDWPGNVRQLRNVIESMVVIDFDEILDVDDLPPELVDGDDSKPGADDSSGLPTGLIGQPLQEIERWAIIQTLQLTGGNRDEAAKILEIGERTLYRKLKKYELQDKS